MNKVLCMLVSIVIAHTLMPQHVYMPKKKYNKPYHTNICSPTVVEHNDREDLREDLVVTPQEIVLFEDDCMEEACMSNLWYFMEHDFTELALQVITSNPADIKKKNAQGETPLVFAIKRRNAQLVLSLVNAGVLDTENAEQTAMEWIATVDNEEQKQELLKAIKQGLRVRAARFSVDREKKEKAASEQDFR